MIHSKSIQVLKTLSKEELKQFSDFLRSPFHNKNRSLIKLYDVLKKYHPEYEVENEKIYSKIYPGKEYNHDNMKKLMSEEFIVLEKFLLELKIKKEKFIADTNLLEEYLQRNLNEIFLFKVKKMNEKMEEVNYYNYNFDEKLRIEDLILEFYRANNMDKKVPNNILFERSEYSLCNFWDNTIFDISNITIFRRNFNVFKEDLIGESFLRSFDIKSFLKYLLSRKVRNDFMIFQINLILMLIYPENDTYFYRAKNFLLRDANNFIKENYKTLNEYLILLENYCIMKVKKEKKYELVEFELYKYHLKIILNNDNKLFSVFYLNLIKTGIRLGELKWAEDFIKDNTKYLEEKEKENTYDHGKALLEFAKQNYEESLNYASKSTIRTSYYLKMHVNILTLQCYFELSLYDCVLSSDLQKFFALCFL